MKLAFTAQGLPEVITRFKNGPQFARSQLKATGVAAEHILIPSIRSFTPVKTGRLRLSIQATVRESAGHLEVKTGSQVVYARFINDGVDSRGRRRRAGPALMFQRGWEAKRGEILDLFRRMTDKIAEQMGR